MSKIATPPFEGFPLEAQAFLAGLAENNEKPWFQEHKAVYERAIKVPAEAFAAEMAARLEAQFDRAFKTHLFRIYRDTRFSKDKTPYHTYLRVGFHPVSGNQDIGFYLSYEAKTVTLGAGCFYLADARLDDFRAAVADHYTGPEVEGLLDTFRARGMQLHWPQLRKPPAPYSAAHPRAGLLRYKGFALFHDVTDFARAATPQFLDTALEGYVEMSPLNDWLERAFA